VGLHDIVLNMGNETIKLPLLRHGQSWSYTFTRACVYRIGAAQLQIYSKFLPIVTENSDLYSYICSLHPYMVGEIVVIPRTKAILSQQPILQSEEAKQVGVAGQEGSALPIMAIAFSGAMLAVLVIAIMAMFRRKG